MTIFIEDEEEVIEIIPVMTEAKEISEKGHMTETGEGIFLRR